MELIGRMGLGRRRRGRWIRRGMCGECLNAKRLVYPGLGKCREPQRTPSTNLSIPDF